MNPHCDLPSSKYQSFEGTNVRDAKTNPSYFRVLGVRVNAVQIPEVITLMERWISDKNASHSIAVTNVHVVMEAHHNISFKKALNAADLIVPDGMPLVWHGRLRGYDLRRR